MHAQAGLDQTGVNENENTSMNRHTKATTEEESYKVYCMRHMIELKGGNENMIIQKLNAELDTKLDMTSSSHLFNLSEHHNMPNRNYSGTVDS